MRPALYFLLLGNAWGQLQPDVKTAEECLASLDRSPRATAANRTANASACVARFGTGTPRGPALVALAKLQAEANRYEDARASLNRRLDESDLTDTQRADALAAFIDVAQRMSRTSDPGVKPVRVAEEVAPQLDRLGESARWQQFIAYRWLNSYYRNEADDHGKIAKAANRLIDLFRGLPAGQQAQSEASFGLFCAYENLARSWQAAGDSVRAVAVLREGVKMMPAGSSAKALEKDLGRFDLVGKRGADLEAPHWLNADPANGRLAMAGKVTVIEFTAHWCVPCKATYPALVSLQQKFGDRLQVLLSTSLYGYFGRERDIAPAAELAADRKFFLEEHKLPFPLAVAESTEADVNYNRYFVQAIPHIVVLDAAGIVRRFVVGWEPEDEATVTRLVEELVARR